MRKSTPTKKGRPFEGDTSGQANFDGDEEDLNGKWEGKFYGQDASSAAGTFNARTGDPADGTKPLLGRHRRVRCEEGDAATFSAIGRVRPFGQVGRKGRPGIGPPLLNHSSRAPREIADADPPALRRARAVRLSSARLAGARRLPCEHCPAAGRCDGGAGQVADRGGQAGGSVGGPASAVARGTAPHRPPVSRPGWRRSPPAGRQGLSADAREALLDEAVAALRAILHDRPGLVRVRLELARAFFLKGEDSLARQHFERVLAGKPPAAVAANVNRFLALMRARQRWSGYFGIAIAPDSNINAASGSDIIYLDTAFGRLPFRRDAASKAQSGLGVSVWGGGEYEYPLHPRLKLRAGAELARREYRGRKFDRTYAGLYLGPRWLVGADTEVSLLAEAQRQWIGGKPNSDALGLRVDGCAPPGSAARAQRLGGVARA